MAKVLCIEDEPELRQDIVEELGDAGYDTLQAANGVEGLEAIRTQQPDLVICDVTMPVMDGHQLLRTLRDEHPEFNELPFLFLTALGDRSDTIEGRKLGADAYLTKPIDFEMLLVEIESRLAQVDRMAQVKQQELIRLYKAMAKEEPAAAEAEIEADSPDQIAAAADLEHRQITTGDGKLCPMSFCGFDESTLERMRACNPTPDDPDRFQAELDLLLLAKMSKKIQQDIDDGAASLFIVPVHFASLRQEDRLALFTGACTALADPVKRQLGLEIVGVPAPLLGSHMHYLSSSTASHARIRVLEVGSDGLLALSELMATFRLISVDAYDLAELAAEKPDQLERSLHKLRGKGVKLMVKNTRKIGATGSFSHLSVDFFM